MNSDLNNTGNTAEVEPTVTLTTVPMWLFGLLLLAFLGATVFFDAYGGWFDSRVYGPFKSFAAVEAHQPQAGDNPLPKGKVLFEANCALCHGSDGNGKPGQGPPLAGSEWVLAEHPNRLIRIPQVGVAGPITVKGQAWNLNMAGMGAMYSDDDLAAVLSYVRNSWGNQAPFVTAEQVNAVRADMAGRVQPFSADELMKLPEEIP